MKRIHIATLFFLMATAPSGRGAERPNILFLFADDWGRHASAYARVDGPGSVNDPYQMKNLAADPKYSQVVARLEQQLLEEMRATGDPRLVDNGRFFEDVKKFDVKQ